MLEAIERIEEYVEGWQIFDERGPERRFVLDCFPCIVVYVVTGMRCVNPTWRGLARAS